jgi:hypothetical protein
MELECDRCFRVSWFVYRRRAKASAPETRSGPIALQGATPGATPMANKGLVPTVPEARGANAGLDSSNDFADRLE